MKSNYTYISWPEIEAELSVWGVPCLAWDPEFEARGAMSAGYLLTPAAGYRVDVYDYGEEGAVGDYVGTYSLVGDIDKLADLLLRGVRTSASRRRARGRGAI